jgi:hypothetical protein
MRVGLMCGAASVQNFVIQIVDDDCLALVGTLPGDLASERTPAPTTVKLLSPEAVIIIVPVGFQSICIAPHCG